MVELGDSMRSVRRWLVVLWALVWLMVAIGGVTRLTGSGLSIVQWKPVTGVVPPIGERAWQAEFEQYKSSPQFRLQNGWMQLADFKQIYFWEYVHRLVGRLIGIACFVPWLWFAWKRRLRGAALLRTGSVFLLGGLQGAVGWYMVKSGLFEAPRVSHFRLAMHLTLAFAVGMWILWQALDLRAAFGVSRVSRPESYAARSPQRWYTVAFLVLVSLQIVYGAFMAGTHAGHLYSTFPDMNGHYAPGVFLGADTLLAELTENPALIHYAHRVLGMLVLGFALALAYALRAQPGLARWARSVGGLAVVQAALGILAVVLHVPLVIAALHQLVAYGLCSLSVALCHDAWRAGESQHAAEGRDRDGGLAGARQDLRRA